jgi:hypothetical protein
LALAKQASDPNTRAFLVEMAWEWLDLAELDEWDNWQKALRLLEPEVNPRPDAQQQQPSA